MAQIYDLQTDLTIKLETGRSLVGTWSVFIITKNPNEEMGSFTAVVDNAEKGIIKYVITAPLLIVGEWTMWAKAIDDQGLVSIGTPSTFKVTKSGK